jgi:hypothetical protein
LIEGLAEDVTTAFDQHTRDFASAKIAQHRAQCFVSAYQGAIPIRIAKDFCRPREPTRFCENHSYWLNMSPFVADSETRIIPADCLRSNNDGIDDRSKFVCMRTRRFRSKPSRFVSRTGQMTVKTHPTLRDYKWFAGDNPFVEGFIESRALLFQDASDNIDAASTQKLDSAAAMLRIWVNGADDEVANIAFNDVIRTRRGPSSR